MIQAMTLSPEQRDMLIKLLRELTPGHVSTLNVALDEPDSQIGTSTDSENYAFLPKRGRTDLLDRKIGSTPLFLYCAPSLGGDFLES